jgi:outer membrane protein assembly factor BamB
MLNGRWLATALGMASLGWVATRPTVAEGPATKPDVVTQPASSENPYHPGETIVIHRDLPTDVWPQLGNTPQRTNYTPMVFDPPQGRKKWAVCLTDLDIGNRLNPTVQPIIAEGRVYVGCKNGKLFALDAKTGKVAWAFQAGGPICHTAGYAKGKVMVAALDGCVYAVDAGTGQQQWVFSDPDKDRRVHGFSTAVLLAEDHVFAVDRGGRLFCLSVADGKEIWHYDSDAPVDQSPAYDAGKVFFASEDMIVHAVDAATGAGVWKSEKLDGLSFRWFYPVVVSGKVIVRSLCGFGGITDNTLPGQRSLFALDEDTGKQNIVLKQRDMGHDGTQPPPAVTRDGLLLMHNGVWALEALSTQKFIMPLMETTKRPPNIRSAVPWMAGGGGGGNENGIASVVGDNVLAIPPLDTYTVGTPYFGGAFNLITRRWYVDVRGAQPTANSQGWEPYGGDGNESGGSDAMSAADGLLYHCVKRKHIVICYEPVSPSILQKQETP